MPTLENIGLIMVIIYRMTHTYSKETSDGGNFLVSLNLSHTVSFCLEGGYTKQAMRFKERASTYFLDYDRFYLTFRCRIPSTETLLRVRVEKEVI